MGARQEYPLDGRAEVTRTGETNSTEKEKTHDPDHRILRPAYLTPDRTLRLESGRTMRRVDTQSSSKGTKITLGDTGAHLPFDVQWTYRRPPHLD